MNIKSTINKIIFVVIFLFTPLLTFAEEQPRETVRLYIDSGATQVAPGSKITISLRIDSVKPVNAFDIVLEYQKQLLEPVIFNDSSSIVSIWKNRQLDPDNGIIKLSGGMVNSFSGDSGVIANIKFRAESEGKTNISFRVSNVYYSDGSGTKAEVMTKPLEITISKNALLLSPQEKNDTVSPVFEFVKTAKNPGDGKYLAIFSTKDYESGINALYLRAKQWFIFSEWEPVFSPVELPRGTWQYQISAVDNNGNTSVKTLYVLMEIAKKLFVAFLLFFILGSFYFIIKKWVLSKK